MGSFYPAKAVGAKPKVSGFRFHVIRLQVFILTISTCRCSSHVLYEGKYYNYCATLILSSLSKYDISINNII